MASERPGSSSWLDAQASTFARSSCESRIAVTGLTPVAGLPAPGRFPPIFFDVALVMVM